MNGNMNGYGAPPRFNHPRTVSARKDADHVPNGAQQSFPYYNVFLPEKWQGYYINNAAYNDPNLGLASLPGTELGYCGNKAAYNDPNLGLASSPGTELGYCGNKAASNDPNLDFELATVSSGQPQQPAMALAVQKNQVYGNCIQPGDQEVLPQQMLQGVVAPAPNPAFQPLMGAHSHDQGRPYEWGHGNQSFQTNGLAAIGVQPPGPPPQIDGLGSMNGMAPHTAQSLQLPSCTPEQVGHNSWTSLITDEEHWFPKANSRQYGMVPGGKSLQVWCISCYLPLSKFSLRCDDCSKKRRDDPEFIELRSCLVCHKLASESDTILCEDHMKQKARFSLDEQRILDEQGICKICRQREATGNGIVTCEGCRRRTREKTRDRRAKSSADGRCVSCGDINNSEYKACEECRESQNERRRK